MTQAPPPADLTLQRSSRDPETMRAQLTAWLATQLPPGADPVVVLHTAIQENGLSSETVLLDVTWTEGGQQRAGQYVARVAPAPEDLPVFESYALQDQYDAIRIVGELTEVPVPAVRWIEPTGDVLGTPFFLMDRIDGLVPPDVLPYNFGDNWLYDATARGAAPTPGHTVEGAGRAARDPGRRDDVRLPRPRRTPGDTPLARNLARTRAWYEFAVTGHRSLADRRARPRLAGGQPARRRPRRCCAGGTPGSATCCTGTSSRSAVLDWEMAALGPRELDVVLDGLRAPGLRGDHRHARAAGHAALPARGRRGGDVRAAAPASSSATSTGTTSTPRVQWGIVFLRTGARQIHFGEIERPDDIETLMHHKPLLERLLAGRYW